MRISSHRQAMESQQALQPEESGIAFFFYLESGFVFVLRKRSSDSCILLLLVLGESAKLARFYWRAFIASIFCLSSCPIPIPLIVAGRAVVILSALAWVWQAGWLICCKRETLDYLVPSATSGRRSQGTLEHKIAQFHWPFVLPAHQDKRQSSDQESHEVASKVMQKPVCQKG